MCQWLLSLMARYMRVLLGRCLLSLLARQLWHLVVRYCLYLWRRCCGYARSGLVGDLHQRLRQPRFQFWLTVEFRNQQFGNFASAFAVCLFERRGLGPSLPVSTGQSRQAVERVANGVKSIDGNGERSLLLSLHHNLIDPFAQLEIGAAEQFLGRQQRRCRAAAGGIFLDDVGGRELEAIRPVPVHARRMEAMVARNLRRRLTGGEAAVDLRSLQMLSRGA
jgi:hypothetical protein